ncbi:MAG: ATP-dependent Clp protease adaptor ClpS [Phycisphaerae bacterium]|nr:ATP-dependent Clp protease adaptor ClpS [Phycisphaerae bacterium]
MSEEKEEQSLPPTTNDGAQDVGHTAVAVPKRKPAPGKLKPGQLPQYKVLLHNDDVNTFDHVARSVFMLMPLQQEEAIQKTIEAHEAGVSLLLVTHLERAELYQEQFASLSLTVTIEPDA